MKTKIDIEKTIFQEKAHFKMIAENDEDRIEISKFIRILMKLKFGNHYMYLINDNFVLSPTNGHQMKIASFHNFNYDEFELNLVFGLYQNINTELFKLLVKKDFPLNLSYWENEYEMKYFKLQIREED
jgi:hypothetical protein